MTLGNRRRMMINHTTIESVIRSFEEYINIKIKRREDTIAGSLHHPIPSRILARQTIGKTRVAIRIRSKTLCTTHSTISHYTCARPKSLSRTRLDIGANISTNALNTWNTLKKLSSQSANEITLIQILHDPCHHEFKYIYPSTSETTSFGGMLELS